MRTLLTITALLLVLSCSSTKNVHEDRLYITRKYVGDFQAMEVVNTGRIFKRPVTYIRTSRADFYVIGEPELDVHEGARCYVKYFPEKIPNSISTVPVLYFTWNGTYDMYEVWQNIYTGEIY